MLYESTYYGVACIGDNSLYHHGIKGQKWGVRRYQNADGSYTAEGKARRQAANQAFVRTEITVNRMASNKVMPFKREPLNISSVKRRGNLNDDEAKECMTLANSIFEKASVVEPRITNDVIAAVSSSGSKMYGLQYRLKQPTSLASKIGSDAKDDGVSFKKAGDGIKDAIRYTAISNPEKFVSTYRTVKSQLEKNGYTETRCKNYFDLYSQGKVMHKSVQSVFEDKAGNKFELQFQTPASQAAKELKIPIYEERRQAGLTEFRKRELEQQMVDLAERVKNPKKVMSIRSH